MIAYTVSLIAGLGLIFLAAELFTNAIEWFGRRLRLSEGAVGSVLAAVGTALPETSVAITAVVIGGRAGNTLAVSQQYADAGIGAILGAPMMLSTLAMFITGAAVLIFAAAKIRKSTIQADYQVVGRDLRSFFLVYLLALLGNRESRLKAKDWAHPMRPSSRRPAWCYPLPMPAWRDCYPRSRRRRIRFVEAG